jgi:hypothetical protein
VFREGVLPGLAVKREASVVDVEMLKKPSVDKHVLAMPLLIK